MWPIFLSSGPIIVSITVNCTSSHSFSLFSVYDWFSDWTISRLFLHVRQQRFCDKPISETRIERNVAHLIYKYIYIYMKRKQSFVSIVDSGILVTRTTIVYLSSKQIIVVLSRTRTGKTLLKPHNGGVQRKDDVRKSFSGFSRVFSKLIIGNHWFSSTRVGRNLAYNNYCRRGTEKSGIVAAIL